MNKIYNISSIFLYESLLMISGTYICKTYAFKVILFITLLNYLKLLKGRGKM